MNKNKRNWLLVTKLTCSELNITVSNWTVLNWTEFSSVSKLLVMVQFFCSIQQFSSNFLVFCPSLPIGLNWPSWVASDCGFGPQPDPMPTPINNVHYAYHNWLWFVFLFITWNLLIFPSWLSFFGCFYIYLFILTFNFFIVLYFLRFKMNVV